MKYSILTFFIVLSFNVIAQPTGYYDGTEGKTGEELKSQLNDIISGHMEWGYFYAKNIFILSDAVPDNPGYVYTVYKGSEVDATDSDNWGTGGDYLNREHVWAKSHGQFDTDLPTGGDAHNLKPADGSVNISRSNKDFDNCQADGQQHDEATGCYYTSSAWEPRDEVKGDIARIIFYMATRYEGENDEVDLEVNDEVDNSPQPLHGRLSALLQWNEQDPPDDFERNRNDVIFSYQQNRNPFIDHPEWIGMIWESDPASDILIGDVSQSQQLVFTGDAIDISATITGTGTVNANLLWGTSYTELTNSVAMTADGDTFTGQIPAQDNETDIYFSIEATDDNETSSSVPYMYHVEAIFNGSIMTITDVQGETSETPYEDQEVTITGVVTANFGEGFFVQDDNQPWSGIYVYDVFNPQIGDSVILTGTVTEYYGLTEIVNVTDYYLISRNNSLPEPIVITTSGAGEEYESVLIQVQNTTCISEDEGYGMWQVSDATGNLLVHNNQVFEYTPELNETYNITGPLKWDYGEWKIEIRKEGDVAEGTDVTPPELISIEVSNTTSISVTFSENLDETTSEDISNYVFNNGISTVSASLNSFTPYVVNLDVTGLSVGTHELTVNGVQDIAGNTVDQQTMTFNSSVGLENVHKNSFIVYPNPSKGKFTISGIRHFDELIISDVSGRAVKQVQLSSSQDEITIQNLDIGVYFVHLNKQGRTETISKIIVE